MQNTRRAKYLLEASVVIAVAFSLIMPFTAATNDIPVDTGYQKVQVTGEIDKKDFSQNTFGTDVLVTPYTGDDILPSITVDQFGNSVVTWTNEQSFSESFFGIGYSSDISDAQAWYDNGLVLTLSGNDYAFDTALVIGPEPEDYKGLIGVYYSLADELAGYYEIPDITSDFSEWPIYTWSDFGEDSYYSQIADQGFIQGGYYPDMFGPMVLYIAMNDLCGDIPQCPAFTHIDIRNDGGGVMFYDCQEYEQTAPAGSPDFVAVGEIYHTIVYNVDTQDVIWKKVDATVEHDYEYTPFQATVGTGTHPSIAAYDTNVAVVYATGGEVVCVRSSDDGETWSSPVTIASGGYPDICSVGTTLFAAYIDDGNLFKAMSEDGGATWIDIQQVNDVDGTVVEVEDSVDMHEGGIVWVDERGEDWDIYIDELSEVPSPDLEIKEISGGIGVSAVIENVGDLAATNVEWTITLDGTVFLGGEKSDTIPSLGVGDTATIKSGFPLGFGGIEISITATCDEGDSASASAQGNLLLFFVTGL